MKKFFRIILRIAFGVLIAFVIGFTTLFFSVTGTPEGWEKPQAVNDVTQLNPTNVSEIVRPVSLNQLSSVVKNHSGTISIGGARHSMGGQIVSENSLHVDMRGFNRILSFSPEARLITVESGTTWREIQQHIDPYLSVSIMQTYANFTVGGSLSVNVHGRYIGQGPIIHSVEEIKVVLADGSIKTCSRNQNTALFNAFIGGYGGLGVIAEVTLHLTENCRVSRTSEVIPVNQYRAHFYNEVRSDSTVVFHNGDLYPEDFTEVRSVSYRKTTDSLTVHERLKPIKSSYRVEQFGMWLVSEMPFGKWLRKEIADRLYYHSDKVVWRNYEASYDANELEPRSRKNSTYVLQEYFVPIDEFENFVPTMTEIFKKHDVNVINVSIRHALSDTLSILSWAPQEVFCFVIYYKQGTRQDDYNQVGVWTRELVDAALSCKGSYYLPYQTHATEDQFKRAYAKLDEFYQLKLELDSSNKFRNKLWNQYYRVNKQ